MSGIKTGGDANPKKAVTESANAWGLGGNTIGTDSNKLGTLDNKDLEIITNNILRFIIQGSDGWIVTPNGSVSLDPLQGALFLQNLFGVATGSVSFNIDSGATGGGGGSISATGGLDLANQNIIFNRSGRVIFNGKQFFETNGNIKFTETNFFDAWFDYNNTTKEFKLGSNAVDVLLPALPNLSSLGTDANGKIIAGTGGGGTQTLTKAQLDTAITNSTLTPGAFYFITGVDAALYGGTTVLLQATSTNTIGSEGYGLFYNPKYDNTTAINGVWNKFLYANTVNVVGTFQSNETITNNLGGTAIYLAEGFYNYLSGAWDGATTITGDSSGATADISGTTNPSYAIGQKAIWGGKTWTNLNGNIGDKIDYFSLDAEWQEVAFNAIDYNVTFDKIAYDYQYDLIIERYEKQTGSFVKTSYEQNLIWINDYGYYNPIKSFQWGYYFNFNYTIGNKCIINNFGNLFNLNNCGSIQDMTLEPSAFSADNTLGKGAVFSKITLGQSAVFQNITLSQGAYFNTITLGQSAGFNSINLGKNAFFQNITLGQSAGFSNINLGKNAFFQNITLGQNAGFQIINLGQSAGFSNINLGQSASLNSTGTLTQNIENLTIQDNCIINSNLTTATTIYQTFYKTIFAREDGTPRLSYYNNSDVQVILPVDN